MFQFNIFLCHIFRVSSYWAENTSDKGTGSPHIMDIETEKAKLKATVTREKEMKT